MRERWLIGLIGLCGMLLFVACTPASEQEVNRAVPDTDATITALTAAVLAATDPPVDLLQLQQDLDQAEDLWRSQNITRYTIQVNHRQHNWDTQMLTITVENGQVVESTHTCYPQRSCIMRKLDAQNFTVENLFNVARSVIALGEVDEITFNQTYGYANAVIYEDGPWTTSAFQVLTP